MVGETVKGRLRDLRQCGPLHVPDLATVAGNAVRWQSAGSDHATGAEGLRRECGSKRTRMSFRRDWILSKLMGPRPTPANRLRFLHHLSIFLWTYVKQHATCMPCWLGPSCVLTATQATRGHNRMQNHSAGRGRAIRGRRDRRSASSCHGRISARSTSTLTGEVNSGAAGTCAWRASSIWAHESQCTLA